VWVATGLVVGFCSVGRLGGILNPFADLRAGCLAAICGAMAMLVFHIIAQPTRLPKAAVPVNLVSRGALFGAFLLISIAALITPFCDRFAYAMPDHARILYRAPVRPVSVTLYSYILPQPYLGGANWRTNGHSITLRVRAEGTDGQNSVEDRATIPLARSEIMESGGDPAAFLFANTRDTSQAPAVYSPVNISIVRGTELEELANFGKNLRDRTLRAGEKTKSDGGCNILWRWRENPGQPSQVDWQRPGSDPSIHVEGAPNETASMDPVRLYCSMTSCGVSFPYRGMIAQMSIKWSSICDWRNHKKAVVRALDRRLIRETSASY
jgi:hypothetical protein